MRRLLFLGFFFSMEGCVNAVKMCGLEQLTEWHQLRRAPINETELVALVVQKESKFPSYDSNQHHWFGREDGALLLCRQDSRLPSDPCSSDGWAFTKVANVWRAENKWMGICPVE